MEAWLKDLVKGTLDIIYAQWATLNANVTAAPCRGSVVDPEALVVATSALGRYDARIFDEAMDWCTLNHRSLKPWRLKRIAVEFGEDTTRCLAAIFDFIGEKTEVDLFPGVIQIGEEAIDHVPVEPLFFSERKMFNAEKREPDQVFLRWKLKRGTPRMRGHSGSPDMRNPGNLMIRLRSYYGTGAKADVVTYLLTGKGGSSKEIASKIKYNQKSVYDALEQLVGADMAYKRGGVGNAYYWVDPRDIAQSLGLKDSRPVFFVWADIYRVIFRVLEDIRSNDEKWSSPFFSAERAKNLAVEAAPIIRGSGVPLEHVKLPDISRAQGNETVLVLKEFLAEVLATISRFMD
jgi:hypothetical protein